MSDLQLDMGARARRLRTYPRAKSLVVDRGRTTHVYSSRSRTPGVKIFVIAHANIVFIKSTKQIGEAELIDIIPALKLTDALKSRVDMLSVKVKISDNGPRTRVTSLGSLILKYPEFRRACDKELGIIVHSVYNVKQPTKNKFVESSSVKVAYSEKQKTLGSGGADAARQHIAKTFASASEGLRKDSMPFIRGLRAEIEERMRQYENSDPGSRLA